MNTWLVELITNENVSNLLEIEAGNIVKVNHQTLLVDGVEWKLPEGIGLSFAEVSNLSALRHLRWNKKFAPLSYDG